MKIFNNYYLVVILLLSSCYGDSFSPSSSSSDGNFGFSQGGSTAKFAVKENILYVVDSEELSTYDISKENETVAIDKIFVGWGVETIFPFGDLLFLGTQSGVFIYDISIADRPEFISNYQHIVACDPVVTDGTFAYLTLRTGTNCGRPINELQILDLSAIEQPVLISSFPMKNPKGLAIHNNTLFVCDDGIKVFDVSNKYQIVELFHIQDIPANDVIFYRNQLLVTADNGFYQFNASDLGQISFYSF
jgi:hypothetical protein